AGAATHVPLPLQVWVEETQLPPLQLVPAGAKVVALHAALEPPHCPEPQPPLVVHDAPAASKASAGQLAEAPAHVSATSHGPAAARQTVPMAANRSAGHAALAPLQLSALSQGPALGRHTVPAATS